VVHNPILKKYYQKAKELIEKFLSFNMQVVPRASNHVVDTLALVGLYFTLDFVRFDKDIKVQILQRHALHDKIDSWQVFDIDEQICKFLQSKEEFEYFHISTELEEETRDIIQLKTNKIPPSLFMLESMFDYNDASTFALSIDSESIKKVQETILIIIGTEKDPKLVHIGSQCSPSKITQLIELLTEFKDLFSYSYEDLKVFNMQEIVHSIPIIPDQKPYK
jgi:hypothetical protein